MFSEKYYSSTSLFYLTSLFQIGDGGYVRGGSLKMIEGMTNRYKELGGNLQFNQNVEKVVVSDGKAIGVQVGGKFIKSDAVIVSRDTLSSIDTLFNKPIDEEWSVKMRKITKPVNACLIALGIEADLSEIPAAVVYPFDTPVEVNGMILDHIRILNYSHHRDQAPPGCSSITTLLHGDTYELWKQYQTENKYQEKKKELADFVINVLSEKIPVIKGKVKVVDVTTPVSYEKWSGSYHGSYMTYLHAGDKMFEYPLKSKTGNLYFVGQRLHAPGGLPPSIMTGRKAVQYLCKDFNTTFQ